MTEKQNGMVLEGGAKRGMFTCGILDVFLEENITVDGYIGVSAGAAFGCNYESKQKGRAIRYNKQLANDWRYCSWKSFFLTGDVFGAKFCYDTLPNEIDLFDTRTFTENPIRFYTCATDVKTGRPVYYEFTTGDAHDLAWMRASASMPIVSQPVKVDGYSLLDGGCSDPIPLLYFQQLGYQKNIVILTQPRNYRKQPQKHKALYKAALAKYPAVYEDLIHRDKVYNATLDYIAEQEKQGKVLVLAPKEPLNISPMEHDPNQLQRVYDEGYKLGKEKTEEVRDFLIRR